MTGSIRVECKGCGDTFWVTWGNGGPKEFLATEDQKRYCCSCREARLEDLPDAWDGVPGC